VNKSTVHKILSDPNFDPSMVFEQALVEFIEQHPATVAKDEVCLKHLVKDPEVCHNIVSIIPMNNSKLLGDFLLSIKRMNWGSPGVSAKILTRLDEVEPENVCEILETIKKSFAAARLTRMHPEFIDKLTQAQIDEFVKEAAATASIKNWKNNDWEIAFKSEEGIQAFLSALVEDRLTLKRGMFGLVATCAKAVAGNAERRAAILQYLDDNYEGYVCFKCGRGSGVDSNGKRKDNDKIKSLSGYTLHRSSCDPSNEFLSPHEIFSGSPKVLSFKCGWCGETFTTSSGRTLHEKKCKGY